jgi:hypothetical protein
MYQVLVVMCLHVDFDAGHIGIATAELNRAYKEAAEELVERIMAGQITHGCSPERVMAGLPAHHT